MIFLSKNIELDTIAKVRLQSEGKDKGITNFIAYYFNIYIYIYIHLYLYL